MEEWNIKESMAWPLLLEKENMEDIVAAESMQEVDSTAEVNMEAVKDVRA